MMFIFKSTKGASNPCLAETALASGCTVFNGLDCGDVVADKSALRGKKMRSRRRCGDVDIP